VADRIPPGTRDVLPDEMRELRRIESALLETFTERGYGEVRTPLIEYADVLDEAGPGAGGAYRFLDDSGDLLALRNDMTVPIARLAATRLQDVPPPWRLCYAVNSFRPVVARRGELREFGQTGIELIDSAEEEPIAEVIRVLEAGLSSVGLGQAVIGLGDSGLIHGLLSDEGVRAEVATAAGRLLAAGELVEIESFLERDAELDRSTIDSVMAILKLRGGPEVLDEAGQNAGEGLGRVITRLRETVERVRGEVDLNLVIDLGLTRDQAYYSGAILEVYEPSVGRTIGGGGRYDGLVSAFGLEKSAAGFSLYVERIHAAQLEEEAGR